MNKTVGQTGLAW